MGARRTPRSVVVTAVVAALVTAAALVAVGILRIHEHSAHPDLEVSAPSSSPVSPPDTACGEGPCRVLTTITVAGERVELLADAQGAHGRLRAGAVTVPITIGELGARLDGGSLSCITASVSACLVSAPLRNGRIGQLVVDRANTWRSVGKPYFSDAGTIVLGNVSGGDAPELTVVTSSPVLARVYALDGSVVGCTQTYSYPSQLRGWPNVRLLASDLRSCP